MRFAKLLATPLGRLARVAVGGILVALGLGSVHGGGGLALAIVGLVPLAAGAFNYCTISPFIGAPFWGKDALNARPQTG